MEIKMQQVGYWGCIFIKFYSPQILWPMEQTPKFALMLRAWKWMLKFFRYCLRSWNEKKACGDGRGILGRNFNFLNSLLWMQRKLMDAQVILVVEICIFFRLFWQIGLLEKVKCQGCGNRMQVIKDFLLGLYKIEESMDNVACYEGHRNELWSFSDGPSAVSRNLHYLQPDDDCYYWSRWGIN